MAKKKYKITPFARLLIFIVIALPLIYLAASAINGEDGIGNIKKVLGVNPTIEEEIEMKEDAIERHEKEIKELQEEISELKNSK